MDRNKTGDSDHAPLPAHVADRLLDLLSTDDEFRAAFKDNPAAALSTLGYQDAETHAGKKSLVEGEAFYCMTTRELASKEEILEAREELKAHLTAYTNHQVIYCFEAGKISSILRRR
ncbi:MAG: NHLP-related RiPP peptide [Gammaproteobacteria bacterium]|nr:NHLP-related RiPP peptide [Gammaproteobacteria bacterium]